MTAIRTLLTVIVAAALVGLSLPAIDDARGDRTELTLEATATRLADASADLAETDDPVPPGVRGASRTLTVTLPRSGFADARTVYVSIGGTPNTAAPSTIGYRAADRPPRRVATDIQFVTTPKPLVLPPGRHVLRLTLVETVTGVGVRIDIVGSTTAA